MPHLYRAMDFLEANKKAMEATVSRRVADLLNLDVEVIFYDTTSLHFEIDEEDVGDQDGQVRGSVAAGHKSYAAPRKRGYSKNGRSDVPQIVVGLAVTREGFPVRHWVFPGNTVDVTTVSRVKEDLRGWQLTRCLFVSDAGMVSQANLQSLSRGGGKYLLAMPMRRGGEVSAEVMSRPGRYHAVWPKICKSRKSSLAKGQGNGATPCASIHRKPGVRGRIERNSSTNWKRNSPACLI
jgi:hypothetical protein